MTGAMYAAVAGLKTHMNKLNVIGNNVSNVNTYGYKAGRATFAESLYTSVRTGSNGTSAIGGTNPAQIGYGCQISTIDLDMSTKNYVPTGGPLHCMINGDGFLMVGDKNTPIRNADALKNLNLTRVGDLSFDPSGYLVDGRGNVVYGFLSAADENGRGKADYANDNNANQTKGVSTELTAIRLPLAAAAPASGGSTDNAPAYEGSAVYPYVDDNGTHDPTTNIPTTDAKRIQLESVTIDETGKITGINKATDEVVVVGYVALASVDNPYGVTHTEGPYYRALGGAGDVLVSTVGSSVKGYLNNKASDAATPTDLITGTGETKLVPNGLESSGTDIATEFSEMITTQRGYQANTRIITVTDAMLEELVNIKR